jgi:regulation of enolase protein 1 (concanavalin A-like superfamily)
MKSFSLPGIPGEFRWHIKPVEWSLEPAGGLYILAGAGTDWFSDPAGKPVKDDAPCALAEFSDDNFILGARVAVKFASTFDAGVIQIRAAEGLGAKLCFEYSPQGRPMIVSVVTRGVSDDCNSVEVDGTQVWLRVARMPRTLAFHYSLDGRVWRLVRYFSLGHTGALSAGFSAQSPTGARCSAIFSEMFYRTGSLQDLRSGE